jgi:esterase/lipase superfamily enzyme
MRETNAHYSKSNGILQTSMRKFLIGLVVLLLLAIAILAIGYQPTIYLMPTPAVISSGDINPFDINPNLEKDNEIRILFATNRIPAGETEDRIYTIFPGNKLRMGIVHMRIGKAGTAWETLFNLSTTAEKGRRPALRLDKLEELAQYPLKGGKVPQPVNTRAMADMVNSALDRSIDKDITIYVHGANTAVYRASAQAAQYHHFTGQNSIVLVFLWPSAENLFAYGTDTRHALKSAPAFAQLLSLLAEHTHAENINILTYSAGVQIASPALDIIGRNTKKEKREAMRLGEIYFAAADIGVDTFTKHLQNYIDMPRSTTLTINMRDSVLSLAAWRTNVSRAGSPDTGDLSEEKNRWIQNASMGSGLNIIEVSAETVSGMSSRSHDYWFTHPWISSDVLTQFLFHKTPGERGLIESVQSDNLRYWTFPPNYPQRIIDIVKQATETKRSQIFPDRLLDEK